MSEIRSVWEGGISGGKARKFYLRRRSLNDELVADTSETRYGSSEGLERVPTESELHFFTGSLALSFSVKCGDREREIEISLSMSLAGKGRVKRQAILLLKRSYELVIKGAGNELGQLAVETRS